MRGNRLKKKNVLQLEHNKKKFNYTGFSWQMLAFNQESSVLHSGQNIILVTSNYSN